MAEDQSTVTRRSGTSLSGRCVIAVCSLLTVELSADLFILIIHGELSFVNFFTIIPHSIMHVLNSVPPYICLTILAVMFFFLVLYLADTGIFFLYLYLITATLFFPVGNMLISSFGHAVYGF